MQAWEQFLERQETELGPEVVHKWLKSLKVQRFDACNLYLEARDSFQALWFEEHMRAKVQHKLLNANHKKIKVHLSIANLPPSSNKLKPKLKTPDKEHSSFALSFDSLDPNATLERFIASAENLLCHRILLELIETAKQKVEHFNPVYIYGKEGSGKTHLLMGLAHAFEKQGFKTLYVRAETFTDHVVGAIRAGKMSHFREAYRKSDVLLVDDVHIFSRKNATQEEFFHTFNTLHLESKQIILAAKCAPQDLEEIEPRLVSRFEWGIVLPLVPLCGEDREKLFRMKAAMLQFPLSDKVITFFLEHFKHSPKTLLRALEALLLRIHLEANETFPSITPATVKLLLPDLLALETSTVLNPHEIVQIVAEQYEVTVETVLSDSQCREHVLPRQIAMHFCRQKLKMPYTKIGAFFGRDHSTVISSVKNIQKALDSEEREISVKWHAVKKRLG